MTESPAQLHRREVGKLYHPDRTSWPDAAVAVNLSRYGCEIVLFYARPTPNELAAFDAGSVRFGWVDLGPAAILAFRVGGLPYMDGSFHPMRQPADQRGLGRPDDEPGETTLEALKRIDEPGSKDDVIVLGASDSKIGVGGHLLIVLTLVDATTGIIRKMRAVTWPPRFVYEVRATIERMMLEPYDQAAEESAVHRFVTTNNSRAAYQLAKVRCVGGEPE